MAKDNRETVEVSGDEPTTKRSKREGGIVNESKDGETYRTSRTLASLRGVRVVVV
jgi:hypothetical protein